MAETKLIQGVWFLPGGQEQYLATLDQIVGWADSSELPTRASFGEWLKGQFNVNSDKTVAGYLQVVTALGMLDKAKNGVLSISTFGQQFLDLADDGKTRLILDRFMTAYLAFPEVLGVYRSAAEPVYLEALMTTLQPYFPHWTSSLQYENRAMWLLSLGCLRQVKGRSYELTDFGREIALQYPSQLSTIEQGVESNGQLASLHTPDSVPDKPDTRSTPPSDEVNSPTPLLPKYSQARSFLRILEGVPYSQYRDTYNEISSQQGNPQEQVDWLDPEMWISERLGGSERELAERIWRESKQNLNPRYILGCWYIVIKHDLLARNQIDILTITDRGRRFLDEGEPDVSVQIDNDEGILEILRTVAEKGPGRRSEFLDEYTAYCQQRTTIHSLNTIKSYLYNRLQNLIERGFVAERGQSYEVTDDGLAYLDSVGYLLVDASTGLKPKLDIRKLAKEMRDKAREQLFEYLAAMDPFKFEELIKLLLEEMGYEEVTVTSATNDKGVDVVAYIELGISSVREVIQAKRHKGSINRTVMDQLRGSLHRFEAVRGTIITTGRFSSGVQQAAFERGAAPITLIDGEKLLDLLMDHQIGVVRRTVEYYDFDSSKLLQFESDSVSEEL